MEKLSTPTQEPQARPGVSKYHPVAKLQTTRSEHAHWELTALSRRAEPEVELPPYGQEAGSGLALHRKWGEVTTESLTPDAGRFCLAKLGQYLTTLGGG